VNFFIQVLQALIALGIGLAGLLLVFSYTQTLGGWTRTELLAVIGVYTIMGGLIKLSIQPNMQKLMEDVQQGTLDYALTKPADSQMLVSVREVKIWEVVDIITGGIVLGIAVAQLNVTIGVWEALGFAAALLLGGLMIYSFWIIMTTGAFWIIRMDTILELFQGIYQSGRWPVTLYPDWLRLGLTFLVPIGFAVTVPAEALTARLTGTTLLAALGLTVLLLGIARWFWRFGLRHYAGASA
jgi:ABC-2 type transport system permease protein